MDIAGSYWSTAKLLYRLTEFPKIMSVETVQLTPQGDASKTGAASPNLGVRLRLTGFIFPNDGKSSLSAPVNAAATVPAAPAAAQRVQGSAAVSPPPRRGAGSDKEAKRIP
jgi:hypothetical protein